MNSSVLNLTDEITVDQWFNLWIEMLRGYRKPKTIINYTNYYKNSIRNVIGPMQIKDVRPMHCCLVLQNMIDRYRASSIKQTRVAMSNMFQYAMDNDVISKNPVGKSVTVPYSSPAGNEDDRHICLDQNETNVFLKYASRSAYYLQYCLVLETGLRASELIGLTLDEIDFNDNLIHVKHTLLYDSRVGWYYVSPKTRQGTRDIYMTPRCREIIGLALRRKQESNYTLNPLYKDLIFLSTQGLPIRTSSYNMGLYRICKNAGLTRISMHTLRHTFATRCVLAGITPKVLQTIMGHADISTTMNIYVHVTDTSRRNEMEKLAEYNKNLILL